MTAVEALERDHANLIALAARAVNDLQRSPGTELRAVEALVCLLSWHMRLEDEMLLPAIELSPGDGRRVRHEHDAIRDLLYDIQADIGGGMWVAAAGNVAELRAMLETHEVFERTRIHESFERVLAHPSLAGVRERAVQERPAFVRALLAEDKP